MRNMIKNLSVLCLLLLAVSLYAADVQVTSDVATGTTQFWTSDNVYHLNGRIFVEDGARLFIEAGTVIKGMPGDTTNASVLVVAQGGKIYAEGTATKPIIMTAESDDLEDPLNPSYDTKGLWGGLIVLGKAPINASGGTDNIEGIPLDPRGVYGGDDAEDCSGVIRYVSIRHGGIAIGEGNEINGLTMGGVGRGTTIEYVEVFANLDDGFEWFGGTVNAKHLIAAFCGDDAFDIDQGLNSKLQFLFAIQHPDFGNMCAEHDGASDKNTSAEPVTNVQIYNATYLGSGQTSTNGKQEQILKLRENWAGAYNNSIFGDYNGYGVHVSGKYDPDSDDRLADGSLVMLNNIWFNCNGYTMADSIGKEDYTQAYLQDVANGNTEVDPQLMGISRLQDAGLDPRPATDGPAWQDLAEYPENCSFFDCVGYKGAFGVTNWAKNWTALDDYGMLADNVVASTNDVQVTTDITAAKTYWTADNVYHLNGRIFVEDGTELYIEAGTVVKGMPGDTTNASVLIVAPGGKIFAEGTGDRPIVFTAESDDLDDPLNPSFDAKGLWGGLILLGSAPINASGGTDNIEGIPLDPRGVYGGDDTYDCSGVVRYTSIRHGGIAIGEGNEINGLTMGGVGRGTTIEYVEVLSNLDDGYEWFGGTVNCDHLVAAFCGDDSYDIDQGLNNKLQFLFAVQHADFGNMCAEHDGASDKNTAATPVTDARIFNATYLGSGSQSSNGKQEQILKLRENWAGAYNNSIFGDYNGYGVHVSGKYDPDSDDRLTDGSLVMLNNIWFSCANYTIADSVGKEDYTQAYLQDAANGNESMDPELRGISRTQDGGLDPRPMKESPAFSGDMADVEAGFEGAAYKGAFGLTNWADDWTALAAYGIMGVGDGTPVEPVHTNSKSNSFALKQNYPNPFNPTTTINFTIAKDSKVTLEVFNMLGQKVATLVDGFTQAGSYDVNWNAAKMASGLYIYQLRTGNKTITKRMMLMK